MSTLDNREGDQDYIHVRRLQLPAGVLAPNIWRQEQLQPAHVSLRLKLSPGFGSAASIDQLDTTTIHYGVLCKTARAACESAQTVASTVSSIRGAISQLVDQGDARLQANAGITITLPKLSAYEGVVSVESSSIHTARLPVEQGLTLSLTFSDLHVMLLIGLNSQERTAPQSVKLTCSLTVTDISQLDTLLASERDIIALVQDTTFETLEALAITTFEKLNALIVKESWAVERVQLIIEKPSAVIWADAPAVEIQRQVIRS